MAKVSVILTTKNEEKNIANCLKSVMRQTHKDLELIVVDNNSTDETKTIARQFTDKVINLGPERSAQRNHGVAVSLGSYVMYLDADMILDENVISNCVQIMEGAPQIAGVYIPERIVGQGWWIQVRNFERSFYDGTVIDAVRFLRRADFIQIGGFDSTMCGPEDWDFDKKVRALGQVAVSRAALNHNEGTFNLDFYLKKKAYYSVSFDRYVQKWGVQDVDVRRQLGFFYRFFWVFCEQGKVLKILAHPILTLGMYYLRFRVGLVYLKSKQRKT
jgi:glycosyltransferase involved in cell wall biosynthesis